MTYESKIHTKLAVDARTFIPIRFRTWASILLGTLFGGVCALIGMLTAEELFANEEAFKSEDGVVTFERDGKISYLGDVEVIKEKIDFFCYGLITFAMNLRCLGMSIACNSNRT